MVRGPGWEPGAPDGGTATESPPGLRHGTHPLSSPSFKIAVLVCLPHMDVVKT